MIYSYRVFQDGIATDTVMDFQFRVADRPSEIDLGDGRVARHILVPVANMSGQWARSAGTPKTIKGER